jgi:hypothetical protein
MSCYLMNEEEIGAIAAANFVLGIYSSKGRFYNAATKELGPIRKAPKRLPLLWPFKTLPAARLDTLTMARSLVVF